MIKNTHFNWKDSEQTLIHSTFIFILIFCLVVLLFKFFILVPIQKHFNNSNNKSTSYLELNINSRKDKHV